MQASTGLKDIRMSTAIYLQAGPGFYRLRRYMQASKICRPAGPPRNTVLDSNLLNAFTVEEG
jgi:hypothetical protein